MSRTARGVSGTRCGGPLTIWSSRRVNQAAWIVTIAASRSTQAILVDAGLAVDVAADGDSAVARAAAQDHDAGERSSAAVTDPRAAASPSTVDALCDQDLGGEA